MPSQADSAVETVGIVKFSTPAASQCSCQGDKMRCDGSQISNLLQLKLKFPQPPQLIRNILLIQEPGSISGIAVNNSVEVPYSTYFVCEKNGFCVL